MILQGIDLSLVYDTDKEFQTYAVDNVNVSFSKGEITAITGPSGSGKSSLIYILAGLRKQSKGEVHYKGRDFKTLSENEKAYIRKKEFGFIYQRHFLFEYLSVMDNVLMGINENNKESRSYAEEILDKLKIKKISGKKPNQISGGQRQRVAIARALINNPEVIFADEPTASLDAASVLEVLSLIEDYKKNAAVLIVTHDKSIIDRADKIVKIADGKIV